MCRMSKRLRFALLLVAAAAAAGVAAFYFVNQRPLTVQVASSERNVPVQVFGLGTVEAQTLSTIGFEVGATLIELAADHGKFVKRGDVLARLKSSEQQAQVARAKANVMTAQAVLARTSSMIDRQAAILTQREEADRRQRDLLKRGVAAIERAEESARDLAVARADHALALADAEVARTAVETAGADLALQTALLEHHLLKAPFDAIVVQRHRELGSVVKASDPVYTIADPESIWVLAHVDEARSGSLKLGQTAEVRLRSLPGAMFAGQITRIGIESDRVSEERRVWVKCAQCPADFHLGEQAEVVITAAILPQALLVPEQMVSGYDGHTGSVWVAENGVAARVKVTLGQRTLDGRIEVSSRLPQGGEVITGPASGLREGRTVRISSASEP